MKADVIAAMAECPEVCEHLHLPAQSGSTRVLKAMRRTYSRERYLDLVTRLRDAIPDLSLTTDLIVGFPGETEDDFAETLSLVEECRYDGAYTFLYSPRPGTEAAETPARRRAAGGEARAHRPPGRGGAAHGGRARRAVRRHRARGAGGGPVAHRPVAAARPPAPEHHRQLHRRRRARATLATGADRRRDLHHALRACRPARPPGPTSSPPSPRPAGSSPSPGRRRPARARWPTPPPSPWAARSWWPTPSSATGASRSPPTAPGRDELARGAPPRRRRPRADRGVHRRRPSPPSPTRRSTPPLAAGRVPIVTGGTGLYLRAALADLRFPDPAHPLLRNWAERLARERPRGGAAPSCAPRDPRARRPHRRRQPAPRGARARARRGRRRRRGRRPLDRPRPPPDASSVGLDPPARRCSTAASPCGCGGSSTTASSPSWRRRSTRRAWLARPLQVIGAREVAAIRAGALDPGRPARAPRRPHAPPGAQAAHLAAPDAGRHVARPRRRARRGRPAGACWRCGRGRRAIRYPQTGEVREVAGDREPPPGRGARRVAAGDHGRSRAPHPRPRVRRRRRRDPGAQRRRRHAADDRLEPGRQPGRELRQRHPDRRALPRGGRAAARRTGAS